jgi:hypothetical protein
MSMFRNGGRPALRKVDRTPGAQEQTHTPQGTPITATAPAAAAATPLDQLNSMFRNGERPKLRKVGAQEEQDRPKERPDSMVEAMFRTSPLCDKAPTAEVQNQIVARRQKMVSWRERKGGGQERRD